MTISRLFLMMLKFFEILKTKMTENILPPDLNEYINEFLNLSQESHSQADLNLKPSKLMSH